MGRTATRSDVATRGCRTPRHEGAARADRSPPTGMRSEAPRPRRSPCRATASTPGRRPTGELDPVGPGVGLDRLLDRVQGRGGRRLVGIRQQALGDVGRPEERHGVLDRCAEPHRLLGGVDGDPGPARIREHRLEPVAVGERERAWRAGLAHVGERHVGEGGGGRHHDPLVLHEVLPAREHEPAGGPCRRGQVGERGNRILEEHHAEAARHRVEGRGRQ